MLDFESKQIEITDSISIHKDNINWDFKRPSKPGGRASNSQATGVQLRFDLSETTELPKEVKDRLYEIAKNKISDDDILLIYSEEHRSQQENRDQCIDKLKEILKEAANPPEERIETKPPRGDANEERIQEKKIIGKKKEFRKPIHPEDIDEIED